MTMRIIRSTIVGAALALAVSASPAFAYKEPPSEPTSSGSSSGGTSVPEPGMLGMMGLALGGLAFARRRQTKRAGK